MVLYCVGVCGGWWVIVCGWCVGGYECDYDVWCWGFVQ